MILPSQKHYMIEALKEALRIMEALPSKKSCDTCVYNKDGRCAASDYMVPPDSVKANGCEAWVWDIDSPPF